MKAILIVALVCALIAVAAAAQFDRYHGELHEVWKLLDSLESRLKSQRQRNIDKATDAKNKYDSAVRNRDSLDAALKQRINEHTGFVNEETAAKNRYNAARLRREEAQKSRDALFTIDLNAEKNRGVREGEYNGAEKAFDSLNRKTLDELNLIQMIRTIMNGIHQHPPCVAQEGATKANFNGNDFCYKAFVGVKVDQHVAQTRCKTEFNGNLVSVHSEAENSFLLNLCKGQTQWIGATDEAKEGQWANFDGTPFDFKKWAPGEPNNVKDIFNSNSAFKNGENSLEEYGTNFGPHTGMWNDIPESIASKEPNHSHVPTCFVCKRLA